ncbi:hypothetical protein OSB04_006143 [Centaurea solstitialis]|uniref:Uncharacterized protein n=1 Tax=Centaurea solstitialis TaxID=347529 RepID=A0AA38THD0_9ASTR|nr:hypothetical protein OSB04_006143 [Centaurea solstitialis]
MMIAAGPPAWWWRRYAMAIADRHTIVAELPNGGDRRVPTITMAGGHVIKMKRHMDHLERLGHPVPLQLATDTILNSLLEDYNPFVINYNMNNMEKTIAELHSMLKTAELNMGAKNKTKDVLMVRDGGVKKKHGHGSTNKGKGPVQAI